MNYVFRMDLPTDGEDGSIGVDDIVAFAAKYLNASRATDEDLADWADLPEDQRENAPNVLRSYVSTEQLVIRPSAPTTEWDCIRSTKIP